MTKEEIEKASDVYAKKSVPQFENPESMILTKAYKIGFIAGAECRQEEIDELVEALKYMFSHWKDDSYNEDFIIELIKKY